MPTPTQTPPSLLLPGMYHLLLLARVLLHMLQSLAQVLPLLLYLFSFPGKINPSPIPLLPPHIQLRLLILLCICLGKMCCISLYSHTQYFWHQMWFFFLPTLTNSSGIVQFWHHLLEPTNEELSPTRLSHLDANLSPGLSLTLLTNWS